MRSRVTKALGQEKETGQTHGEMALNKGSPIVVKFSGTRLTLFGINQKKASNLAMAVDDIDTCPDGFRFVILVRSYVVYLSPSCSYDEFQTYTSSH